MPACFLARAGLKALESHDLGAPGLFVPSPQSCTGEWVPRSAVPRFCPGFVLAALGVLLSEDVGGHS